MLGHYKEDAGTGTGRNGNGNGGRQAISTAAGGPFVAAERGGGVVGAAPQAAARAGGALVVGEAVVDAAPLPPHAARSGAAEGIAVRVGQAGPGGGVGRGAAAVIAPLPERAVGVM